MEIYRLLEKFDKEGNIERKPGSGKSPKLGAGDQKKLKRLVNNKTGVSQNKLALT